MSDYIGIEAVVWNVLGRKQIIISGFHIFFFSTVCIFIIKRKIADRNKHYSAFSQIISIFMKYREIIIVCLTWERKVEAAVSFGSKIIIADSVGSM